MTNAAKTRTTYIAILIMFAAGGLIQAQPVLNVKRALPNWPTIELYFTAECNGQAGYQFDKQNFEIIENDLPIQDFTIWCPDPNEQYPFSVALVFDASGSMQGAGNAGAIAAGNAFVDLMDGAVDEAAVLWFESVATLRLAMTTNRTDLHDAINSLPANGGTACWDGLYAGVSELANSGNNQIRAVIGITDGGDNSSTHTPQDVIALANSNSIRVFTIGLGGVEPTSLESIAVFTGGKFYHASSADQLSSMYQEIHSILRKGCEECYITYQASCKDGGLRTVDLTLKNFCNGSDTISKTYRAPKDTKTYTAEYLQVDSRFGKPGSEILLPVWATAPGAFRYEKFTATFGYDPELCTLLDVVTVGTMLENIPVSISPGSNTITVSSLERVGVNAALPLCLLKFHIKDSAPPGSVAPVDFTSMVFDAGCLKPVPLDGLISIWDPLRPYIVEEGSTTLCEGQTVTLHCAEGFDRYLWSTGDSTKSITVMSAGSYWVHARNNAGDTLMSDTVQVVVKPVIKPGIVPGTPLVRCEGQTVFLSMTGTFTRQRWSTGETGKYITVRKGGKYYVVGTNANGCEGTSDTVTVEFRTLPPLSFTGSEYICDIRKPYDYSVSQLPSARYSWQALPGTVVSEHGNTARIRWSAANQGLLLVTVTDTLAGCSRTDSLLVTLNNTVTKLTAASDTTICIGDTLTLATLVPHDSYLWNTGEMNRQIRVTTSRAYYCLMTDNSCTISSDTISVDVFDLASIGIIGPIRVCGGATGTYRVNYPGPAQYKWTVTGGSIIAGGDAYTAGIQWGNADTGKIYIEITAGSCNGVIATAVLIDQNIAPALNIAADTVLCEGDSLLLEAQSGYSDYTWSNGASGRTIMVSGTGYYFVEATNSAGCVSGSDTVYVLFSQKPQQPSIVQSHGLLICTTQGQRYQWFEDGQTIPGATNDTLVITGAGSYSVQIWNEYGCTAISEEKIPVGLNTPVANSANIIEISPNPGIGLFTIGLQFGKLDTFEMQIVNTAGQNVYTYYQAEPVISFKTSVDLIGLPTGVYICRVAVGGNMYSRNIILSGE